MTLASFDTLVGVKAADRGRLLDRFHTLGIQNGCAGMGILADTLPFSDVQLSPEVGPETGTTKLSEMIVDRLPRRKIARQIPPRTPRAQQIKERVKDAAKAVPAEFSLWRSRREKPLETVPLGLGQVAWIGVTHVLQCSSCWRNSTLPNTL
jgi:hypothetical protein